MSIVINDYELYSLKGLSYFQIALYFAIRERMDSSNRQARISWAHLRKMLYVERRQGVINAGAPTKSSLRRAAAQLEKHGLIDNFSYGKELIFRCRLADEEITKTHGGVSYERTTLVSPLQ